MRHHWSEHELETRDELVKYFTRHITTKLVKVNPAFKFFRIETPVVLLPTTEKPVLRNSTSSGSYDFAKQLLRKKQKLPFVVWQHGKTFQAADEAYRLEYQILYSPSTATAYTPVVRQACKEMLKKQCGGSTVEGNRFVTDKNQLLIELVEHVETFANVIEIAVDLERCVEMFVLQEST
jgi:hypothetical protein